MAVERKHMACDHGEHWQFICAICSTQYCNHPGCPRHNENKCNPGGNMSVRPSTHILGGLPPEPEWLTDMREREVQSLDNSEKEDDMSNDGSTFCPVCGRVREDSKSHRLSMFIKYERVALIPKGTPFTVAKNIAKGVPDAYLMGDDRPRNRTYSLLRTSLSPQAKATL